MSRFSLFKVNTVVSTQALFAAGLALAALGTHAQATQPTEAQVQREIARQRLELREHQLKQDALGLSQGTVLTPARKGPSISDQEIREAAGDPSELAKLFNEVTRGETHQDASPVMMFASTGMPRESLLRMARASRLAKVPIYIKGLPHGMTGAGLKRSLEALRPYVEAGADLQVHPELFSYYKVSAVPSVVVTSQPKVGCTEVACAASFVKIVGDVTLQYALELVAQRQDEIGQAAKRTLAKVEKP